jgi:hypothetical protein
MRPQDAGTLPPLGRVLLAIGLAAGLSASARLTQAATRLVPEVQAAIDASTSGDVVLLSPGTYRGAGNRDIELRGRDLTVKSRMGLGETIIDCEWLGRGFYVHEWETRAARIEGLTILHGYAAPGWPGSSQGGGIFCGLSSPTIVDCRIVECQASDGGGLSLDPFDGVVDGCVISGCMAERGGGIWFGWGEAEIRNCVITGNGAGLGAGVCFGGPGSNRLIGCTVAANLCGANGGGIYAMNPLLLERCIVWGNCSMFGADEIRCGDADIRCSDIDQTGVQANGTITYDEDCVYTDPMFCLPAACGWHNEGDWSLDAASICLPQGNPCGELIGALGQGCGVTPAAVTTWGAIKAMFRR